MRERSGDGERHGRDEQRSNGANGARRRRRADRGPQPGDRRDDRRRSRSTPPSASPRPSPGSAPTRPSGRRSGSRAATTGWASCATGCSTTTSGCSTRCRRRPARSAPTPPTSSAYLADLINFYGTKAAKFIGEESVRPHTPLLAAKKLRVQYRPYPVVGVISPWNFPLVAGARRRDPGPAGRRRGRRQALRVHAAGPGRGGRGLEGGDRRPRRLRLRAGDRRDRRRPGRRRSTSSSSPAPTGPAAR